VAVVEAVAVVVVMELNANCQAENSGQRAIFFSHLPLSPLPPFNINNDFASLLLRGTLSMSMLLFPTSDLGLPVRPLFFGRGAASQPPIRRPQGRAWHPGEDGLEVSIRNCRSCPYVVIRMSHQIFCPPLSRL
jgi:hypothetical protein